VSANTGADPDEPIHLFLSQGLRDGGIELVLLPAAFEEIGKDDGAFFVLLLLGKEVQRDGQGVEVGAIACR